MEKRKCAGLCKRILVLSIENFKVSKRKYDKGFKWDCRKCNLEATRNTPGYIYNKCRRNAEKRKIDFFLSKERYMELTNSPCFYCGVKRSGRRMGLDRVDNKVGYVEGNLVASCKSCNYKKRDLSFQDIEMFYTKLSSRV